MVELTLALVLLGVLAAAGISGSRAWGDALAVRFATEEGAVIFLRARREAVALGGSRVVLEPGRNAAAVVAGDSVLVEVSFGERFGVELDPGADVPVELAFDGLGLGQAASRTVTFRRGGAERALVVSSYGRIRRR